MITREILMFVLHTLSIMGLLTPTSEKIEKIKGCPKKVINTETNEIYNSVKELAQIVKIHHDTLYKVLNGKQKNKTPYKYL